MIKETPKLYNTLKRLIEYSGGEMKGISLTADGCVGQVKSDGQEFMIFVTPKMPKMRLAK